MLLLLFLYAYCTAFWVGPVYVWFGLRLNVKPLTTLPWTRRTVLSHLQYSMCTVDVSPPFGKLQPQLLNNCKLKFPAAPTFLLSFEYQSILTALDFYLIMVMFEYLQPVLLYKNKKLKSHILAKLCECFTFIIHTSAASSSYFPGCVSEVWIRTLLSIWIVNGHFEPILLWLRNRQMPDQRHKITYCRYKLLNR